METGGGSGGLQIEREVGSLGRSTGAPVQLWKGDRKNSFRKAAARRPRSPVDHPGSSLKNGRCGPRALVAQTLGTGGRPGREILGLLRRGDRLLPAQRLLEFFNRVAAWRAGALSGCS